MSKLDKIVHKHLKNKYTENFIKVVELMLEVDESERIDFLDLESIIKEYFPDEQEKNKYKFFFSEVFIIFYYKKCWFR